MKRRSKRGATSTHGNNSIHALSWQFDEVIPAGAGSSFLYLSPVNVNSERLAVQAQAWSEFRFTKLRIELLPNNQPANPATIVVGFSPEIDEVQPVSPAEITELAFARWNNAGTTIPTSFSIPRKALITNARPWYQCNPSQRLTTFPVTLGNVTLTDVSTGSYLGVDFNVYSASSPYQSACQGCFYIFNSSTNQQNMIISYTCEFRDPGSNIAGPPRPIQLAKADIKSLFTAIKEKKVKRSDVMEQLLLTYTSDTES